MIILKFVNRFKAKASKAKQAQSRMKMLEKMGTIEMKDLPVRAKIRIPPPIHTGKESLALLNADLGYGKNLILRGVNLRLERGNHLGVVGYNGAGKSTLLKSLAGSLPLINGERTLGYQVTLSHFSQHSAEQLDMSDDVLGSLQKAAHRELKIQDILNVAGSLLFSGEDVYKKVKMLSGGEKSRVALGQVLLKRSPLLLMDEPTNHLDFDTVETLTEALRDYEGTVIIVSHDRSFIGRIATKILEIHDGVVEIYPGTYDEYVWSLQKGALRERKKTTQAENPQQITLIEKKSLTDKPKFRSDSKRLTAEIKQLQKEISKSEGLIETQESKRDELNDSLMKTTGLKAHDLAKELALVSKEILKLEEILLEHLDSLEKKESELVQQAPT